MASRNKYYNIEGTIRNGFKLSGDYETLDFSFIKLNDIGVRALVGSKSIKQLKRLTVSSNKLTSDSGSAIAESNYLSNLQSLKMYRNKIGDNGVKSLVNSEKLPNLKSLRLAHNIIGPEGARCIAESVNLSNLTTLGLSENKIGDEGLKFLAGSESLKELKILDLRSNNITDEGAVEFSNSVNYPNIQKVELSDNNLTDIGKNALKSFLIQNLIHKRIKETDGIMTCDLSNLGIGDLECEYISKYKEFNNLNHLYLELNNITEKGVQTLTDSEFLKSVTLLSLDRNKIGDTGIQFIVEFKFSNNGATYVSGARLPFRTHLMAGIVYPCFLLFLEATVSTGTHIGLRSTTREILSVIIQAH